jgi:dTDP-4-dehydrorhamnose 3,5-epimerase
MNRLSIRNLPPDGLKLIHRERLGDDRGFLARIFCAKELAMASWTKPIAQINHTLTAKLGTIRGLHYQNPPHAEMKLVTCIRGRVWDVAVDLRPNSKTFLKWHAEELSPENRNAMLIPEGFAHGFQSLEGDCELIYCHSAFYAPEAERGLRHDDQKLEIGWPLACSEISQRDLTHPVITDDFDGVRLA